MSHQNARQSSRLSPASKAEVHQTYHEETLFDAVVTAGAMMACANRRADASARLEFANFVGLSSLMPTFTPADAAEALDSRIRQLGMVVGSLDSEMGSLQQVSDDIGIDEIVRVCEVVAMADGLMQPAEMQVFTQIRSAMGRSRNST